MQCVFAMRAMAELTVIVLLQDENEGSMSENYNNDYDSKENLEGSTRRINAGCWSQCTVIL
jgi:hypothetical protein